MVRNLKLRAVKLWLRDYKWIHTSIGLMGNFCFFVGSVFFLWNNTEFPGVILFIIGSAGMLIGSLGDIFMNLELDK